MQVQVKQGLQDGKCCTAKMLELLAGVLEGGAVLLSVLFQLYEEPTIIVLLPSCTAHEEPFVKVSHSYNGIAYNRLCTHSAPRSKVTLEVLYSPAATTPRLELSYFLSLAG